MVALVVVGLCAGVAYLWRPAPEFATMLRLVLGAATALLVLRAARAARAGPIWGRAEIAVVVISTLLAAVLAQLAFQGFPLSADEFGYNYLADTLRAGRLWNPPLPREIGEAAATLYIADQPTLRASQYTPGWPLVLAGFSLAGLPRWLAGPLLSGVAGVFLMLALRRLALPASVRAVALALVTLAPFWLFTHATYFNHALTSAAAMAVLWLDLREAERSSVVNRAGIGFAFAVMLVTRLDAFVILFGLYALEGLWRRRLGFIAWGLPAAAAALPVIVLFAAYNFAITGHPLTTPMRWTLPDLGFGLYAMGADGPHSPTRAAANTLRWLTGWLDVASAAALLLYPWALARRWRAGALRWFDLALPAAVVFFVFYPDYGGIQHGPRYWFVAHPLVIITVAAGLTGADGLWQVGRWRFDPGRLAWAQAAVFAGFTLSYGAYVRLQTEARRGPLEVAATAPAPAVVLFPDLRQRYVGWQDREQWLDSRDLTRNGIDVPGPVLLARDLGAARTAQLCRDLPGRRIFRYAEQGAPPRGELIPACP